MKLGLDFHGVITSDPSLFSQMSQAMCRTGHEVHIITGCRITQLLKNTLSEMGIQYTHLFSISDYHHSIGTPMRGYEFNKPQIDDDMWDRTKAEYCREHKIDLHIDDSLVYGRYFTTPYAVYK